jgi:hypothetical protein
MFHPTLSFPMASYMMISFRSIKSYVGTFLILKLPWPQNGAGQLGDFRPLPLQP